jgi:hypothetical protein
MGISIRGVHLNSERDEFGTAGRIIKENDIDVRSPFTEIIATAI